MRAVLYKCVHDLTGIILPPMFTEALGEPDTLHTPTYHWPFLSRTKHVH